MNLLKYVREITIFLVLTGVISNLCQNKSHQKYINFTAGLILILMICVPVFKIVQGTEKWENYFCQENFVQQRKEMLSELKMVSQQSEEKLCEKYEENLGLQMEEQCRNAGVDCKVLVELGKKGEIDKIRIRVSKEQVVPTSVLRKLANIYAVEQNKIWVETN